jgi:TP901 family phage tail tape measure protein
MSVGDIQVKLGLDTSAFSASLMKAKAEAMLLGGSFDGIGKSLNNLGVGGGGALGNIGKSLSEVATAGNLAAVGVAAIGAAAVLAGAQMAKMAADYQSAMAKVGATTGQSNQQLKEMQQLMYNNTAQGSRLTMKTQAEIAGGLGGAGLIGSNTSAEDQLKLLRLTERAMVALEAPTDDVIDLFSILQTRYGATTNEMEKSSSSIAQMADETSASNAEIIQATLTMGRLASTVHMTQPEMIALAAATKSSGIEAAEVGTQWGSLVKNLSSSGKNTALAFEQLGMSQEEWFAALQDSKNTGSNAPVLKFLGKLDKALKASDNSAEQSMQLFGSYGMILGGSIAQVIGKYDTLRVSSQKAFDDGVRLTQEYERMTNTMNSMMEAIGAKFSAIGIQIGTALLGPLQDATYQFDQFLGHIMQGQYGDAFKGLYDSILNYNWFGAGVQIVSMIVAGLSGLAQFAGQAIFQLANALITHDWIGSGRSIASQIVSGLSGIGEMARGALSDISSWVNSGGARSAGENLANWVINGAQAVFGAGVDLLGWLRQNLTAGKVSGIVNTAFSMGSELVKLGVKAGSDFVGGIYKAVTDAGGSYFSGISTAAGKVIEDIKKLGVLLKRRR